jgi:hypothetical protein
MARPSSTTSRGGFLCSSAPTVHEKTLYLSVLSRGNAMVTDGNKLGKMWKLQFDAAFPFIFSELTNFSRQYQVLYHGFDFNLRLMDDGGDSGDSK